MPSWQTLPELNYTAIHRTAREFFNVTMITQMHAHIGAHVDAPLHSIQEGKTIDQYPLDKYVGEGVVLDLRGKKPGEEITVGDLEAHGESIRQGDVVMLCTDWSKKRGYNSDYLYKWPYLGIASCKYLTRKKVSAVGTEGLSIAGWTDNVPAQGPVTNYSSAEVHNALLADNILIIEGLRSLDEVLEKNETGRAFFIFAPLNLVGAEAAPCRAMALIPA